MRFLWVVTFSLLAGSAVLPARETADAITPIASVFFRSEQPLHQYRALRRMHAAGEGGRDEAWLEAWTELNGGRFSYHIVSERGSDLARSKVLRPMLTREQELVNNGDGSKSELTLDNYEFTEGGRAGDGTRFVQIKPRRQDILLVDGRPILNDGGGLA